MTVKEAIEELSKLNGEMEILFSTIEDTNSANFMVYTDPHSTNYWDGSDIKTIPPFQSYVKVI